MSFFNIFCVSEPCLCRRVLGVALDCITTGFIRSGKIRGKHIFFDVVRESQGIQQKSQGKVGKSQGDFFGKFLSPMNQDPLFFKIQSIFFKIQLRQVTCEILISAAKLMFLCMYALGVHSSFCCWLILYCSFIF